MMGEWLVGKLIFPWDNLNQDGRERNLCPSLLTPVTHDWCLMFTSIFLFGLGLTRLAGRLFAVTLGVCPGH
jgi:hypothetical protein